MRLLPLLWLLGWTAPLAAQISFSGTVDVTFKHELDKDTGQAASRINTFIKGGSNFNLMRARFFADAPLHDRLLVSSTALYDEGTGSVDLEGAYLIFSGLRNSQALNVLVGKMATVFGTFAGRSFATVNPLVGTPLIYHYFTAAQGSRAAADNAAQLRQRDAVSGPGRGLPLIYDSCWTTGVQLFGTGVRLNYALALTKGSLSNPPGKDNDGVQLVGRVGLQPTMGLKLGLSGAYGPYMNDGIERARDFPAGKTAESFNQRIVGIDLEYTRDLFELYAEAVRNEWEVPNLEEDRLGSMGGYLEGRYTFLPGLYWAVRYGRLDFDEIADGQGGTQPWDYTIQRVETGLGYYLDRSVRLKLVTQLNFKDGPPGQKEEHLVSLQVASAF